MPGSTLSSANAPQVRSSSLSSNSRSNRDYFWKLLADREKKKLQKSFCLFTEDPLRSTTGKKSVELPQLIVTQQPGVTSAPESMCCSYSVVPHLMLERMENTICDSCLWVIVIANKKPNGYWNVPTPPQKGHGREWWLFLARLHSPAGTILRARLATPTAQRNYSHATSEAVVCYSQYPCYIMYQTADCTSRGFSLLGWENKRPKDRKEKRVKYLSLELYKESKPLFVTNTDKVKI